MLSVEYRVAPEQPYPTSLEDAYAGLVWLDARAAEFGIDPEGIAVRPFSGRSLACRGIGGSGAGKAGTWVFGLSGHPGFPERGQRDDR
jgi:alpha/beta hydrolase fold